MTRGTSRWEAAPNYDYLDTLGAADLAWEWLRRNEHYEIDYAAYDQAAPDSKSAQALIRETWGLRFPNFTALASARRASVLGS